GWARISSRGDAIKSASGLVGERSKEGVPARDVAGDSVVADLQAGGAGDGDGVARRYGKRMPFDFRRSAALPLNRIELRRRRAVDLETKMGVCAAFERYLRRPGAENLADERAQIGDVSPVGARENPLQGGSLPVIAAVVQIERDLPLAILHVAWGVSDQRRVQAVENGVAMTALVHVPADDDLALGFRRRGEKDAGTRDFAVARLNVRAFDAPGHARLPTANVYCVNL